MISEQRQKKRQQIRLRKLAHQIKGLPEKQKKECVKLLQAYERWYDYVQTLQPGTEEYNYSVWERNTYQSYLKFALHFALTGDILSRAGVIGFAYTSDLKKKAHLEKREKELIEIDKSIDAFGQSSKQEREGFKKKLKSKRFLAFPKQVKSQSFGQKIID